MPAIDLIVETEVSRSARARQLSAMFDVPPQEKCSLRWSGEIPIDAQDWNVGLIVGPSGAGKSSVARHLFGPNYHPDLQWQGKSVIDDFAKSLSMDEISQACQAVGFNTIPAWLRPFQVLSNGERFRVELARRILELPDPIVVDEFSSVVDRQVSQIGSHGVQKFIRKRGRKFVAVSCHYDIVDWLQPDWIFEPATMHFARRDLQRRPSLDVTISRVPYSAWRLFAPFHYMTAELVPQARCFGLFVAGRIASFAGILAQPAGRYEGRKQSLRRVSRLVTLPDWQGLGLALILISKVGAAYRAVNLRLRIATQQVLLVRALSRSATWEIIRKPGTFTDKAQGKFAGMAGNFGARPCAVFEYAGETMPRGDAERLLAV